MYQTNYTGIIYFIALCFLVLPRLCDLYKLRICDNAESSKSIGTSFQTAFSHLASPCLVWVSSTVFQTFPLLVVLLICGQWPFMGTLSLSWCSKHRACIRWWTWLINILCAWTLHHPSLPVSLSSGSLFIGHSNIELMAVDNPIVASKCSIKERVNPCGQLSPFLLLRNFHSHPTIATTTLINHSCQHWGKTLRQPKDSQWRLRWCLEIFSNKVFVN